MEPFIQEGEDAVECCAGRVAGFIDEVDGEHGWRSIRDTERVSWRGADLDALEGVAMGVSQRFEPLGRASLTLVNRSPEDTQSVARTFLGSREVAGSSLRAARLRALIGGGGAGVNVG
jgi:hypothetical protein